MKAIKVKSHSRSTKGKKNTTVRSHSRTRKKGKKFVSTTPGGYDPLANKKDRSKDIHKRINNKLASADDFSYGTLVRPKHLAAFAKASGIYKDKAHVIEDRLADGIVKNTPLSIGKGNKAKRRFQNNVKLATPKKRKARVSGENHNDYFRVSAGKRFL